MTEDTKTSMIWTGGAIVAVVAIVAVMWAFGVFETGTVQTAG